jgi:hypothetical protein
MPKAKTQNVHDVEPTATAAELMTDLENGDEAVMAEKIQGLGQRDFIDVTRTVQKLAAALADYAQSWKAIELP